MTSISDTFFRHAQTRPSRVAIYFEDKEITYAELARLVARWSAALAKVGVNRGDRIGVILANNIEFVALMLVGADLGAALVPLSVSLPPAAVYRAFVASGARHVVATSSAIAALRQRGAPDFSLVNGLWLAIDDGKEALTLQGVLDTAPADAGPVFSGQHGDPYILTMTSGSTGDPKPIVLTQDTKWNRVKAAVGLYGVTENDITLAATPLYHSLAERLVLIPLLTGGTCVLMGRFSPKEWLRVVRERSVTFTIAVSSQLGQIARQLEGAGSGQITSLRCVVSSSAPLDALVKNDLVDRLHCDLHECYGASEIAIASNLDLVAAETKRSSVGKAAPGVDIVILRDDGEAARTGEIGEIVCRTPMLFGGYLDRPAQTRDAMWGEYFRTGDIGRLDEDGYLYFLGRKKDIIICGGVNIYPADIEAVLAEHPSIAESSAFPLPDDQLGEIPAVAIVPRKPGTLDLRSVRFHCAERLADFQQPRRVFVMTALPRNGMGKVMKLALIKEHGGVRE